MTKIKAECCWGDCIDVMLVIKDGHFVLYENPIHQMPPKADYIHGYVTKGAIDLTSKEARELAIELNKAAKQAEDLNKDVLKIDKQKE